MGLEWFEYYLLKNNEYNLLKAIKDLKKEIEGLKKDIEEIKKDKR